MTAVTKASPRSGHSGHGGHSNSVKQPPAGRRSSRRCFFSSGAADKPVVSVGQLSLPWQRNERPDDRVRRELGMVQVLGRLAVSAGVLAVAGLFGDLGRCALRAGNVHSADGWGDVLKPVVARYQGKVSRIYFRADAAFAMPEVYEFLEAERIKYAIRLPANQVLQS